MALRLRSQRQIQTDILNAIIARLGLTDVNPGSILDVLTQAVSQEDFNQYVQMSQIVRLVDLDSTTGVDLDNRSFEYGLIRNSAQSATGRVNITRTGYTKVSTSFVSAGVLAPSSGDGVEFSRPLRVNDASQFTVGGLGNVVDAGAQIVIGRGTENEETLTIATFVNNGIENVPGVRVDDDNNTIWNIYTTTALVNNHAFSEEIVYIPPNQAQGMGTVTIAASTSVSAPATGTAAAVEFEIIVDTQIDAGEELLEDVDVRALEVGTGGNVGTGNISLIDVEGLSVTNPSAFTTGANIESDNSLRDRIRSHIQSLSRGTRQAVLNAIVGLVDTESSRRVVSANVVLPQVTSAPVRIYIDDGTGFEPTFTSQASETVIENTARGTSRLQLDFAPLPKAQIESAVAEPFDLSALSNLSGRQLFLNVQVGGTNTVPEEITFEFSDFNFPATVRAEEIVSVINDRSTLIEARTSDDGTRVVISAVSDTNENIFVSNTGLETDVNPFIQFTNNEQFSLYLYKNDKLLSKDGTTATIGATNNGSYSLNNTALRVVIDGKDLNDQYVRFNEAQFRAALDDAPSSVTPSQVVSVINNQLAGATAFLSADGRSITLSSDTQFSSRSIIQVLPNDLADITADANDQFGFPSTAVSGTDRDYTLNRELGTIQLEEALGDADVITAGNLFSRASIRSVAIDSENTRIDQDSNFTFTVDGTQRTVTFEDDRFTGTYLDDDSSDGRDSNLYGFNRFEDISNLATFIAEYINERVYPIATAEVREISDFTFIELRTNTYATSDLTDAFSSNGTLVFDTNNVTSLFIEDTGIEEINERPHQAFKDSETIEPQSNLRGEAGYEFGPEDSLIVVMDNDTVNGTFVVNLGVDTEISGSPTTSVITASSLITTFETTTTDTNIVLPNDVNLIDYYAVFTGRGADTDPANTELVEIAAPRNAIRIGNSAPPATSDDSILVTNASPIGRITVTGNESTIFIGEGPDNSQISLADITNFGIVAGDIITISGMQNEVNNGSFVIQSITETNNVPNVIVINESGVEESGSSGECVLSLKRRVTGYSDSTGQMNFGTTGVGDFENTPDARDEIILIPSTLQNLYVQFNNTRLSSLSLSGEVSIVDNGTRLQIASLAAGSNGYVEIAGGAGNVILQFNTDSIRGLQAYNYYTGLLSLVHRTVYGDDRDLTTFPGVGAAGVQFQVLAPTVTEIILEIDVTLNEGVSIAAVENQVNSAVTGYINGLGVGEDVVAEEIRSRVIQINGIRDVALTRLQNTFGSDIVNISVADNEIARISVSDITIG